MSDYEIVPLDQLRIYEEVNIRKTPATAADDEELKGSILAHGLLENLIVRKADDINGTIYVVAGARRYSALKALAEEGAIAADYPVACRMLSEKGTDHEIALAENAIRVAMHPADQVEAFAVLKKQGRTVADIAARFGTSELTVQRRLALAGVDPQIMNAYREGKMDLEAVKAFASTSDKGHQRQVWKTIQNHWWWGPNSVYELLAHHRITVDRGVGRFVGVEAYEAAGGTPTRDLFADMEDERESGIYLEELELVQRLAMEKLEAEAESYRSDGWKWVECRLQHHWREWEKHEHISGGRISKKRKETAGVVLSIDHAGELAIHRYIAPEDREKPSRRKSPGAAAAKKGPYTNPMQEKMSFVRAGIVRSRIASDIEAAHDLVTFHLVISVLGLVPYRQSPLALSAEAQADSPSSLREDETFAAQNPGTEALAEARDGLALDWLDGLDELPDTEKVARAWEGFRRLGQWQKDEIFAWCTARLLKPRLAPSLAAERRYQWPEMEAMIEHLEVRFADWRPTKAMFWGAMRKGTMLEIAAEVLGEDWKKAHAKDKTGDLASAMEAAFADGDECPQGVTQEAWERAKAWTPPGFAAEPYAAAEPEDGDAA